VTDQQSSDAGRSDAHRGSGREKGPEEHYGQTPAQLSAQIRVLNEEVAQLRRRLAVAPTDTRPLERQLTESANRINALSERNEKLVVTLRDARAQLLQLKEEVDRLAQPPSGYGVFLSKTPENSIEVFTGGRRMRLAVSPTVRSVRYARCCRTTGPSSSATQTRNGWCCSPSR
jgi:proteasome-associated ATPase